MCCGSQKRTASGFISSRCSFVALTTTTYLQSRVATCDLRRHLGFNVLQFRSLVTAGRQRGIALGFERIGLVSLRVPRLIGIVLAALAIAAAFGVERIKVDDSLSQLFRSETPEFKQYEEVTRRFPSSEFDVFVVTEGASLLTRESLDALRDFVTDLQLINGTRGIISIFSARQPPVGGKLPAPLFPETLPQGAAFDSLVAQI